MIYAYYIDRYEDGGIHLFKSDLPEKDILQFAKIYLNRSYIYSDCKLFASFEVVKAYEIIPVQSLEELIALYHFFDGELLTELWEKIPKSILQYLYNNNSTNGSYNQFKLECERRKII